MGSPLPGGTACGFCGVGGRGPCVFGVVCCCCCCCTGCGCVLCCVSLVGLTFEPGAFEDLEQNVRDDVEALRNSPFLVSTGAVKAFVYEVETDSLREVPT